jgi:hypothetical protein
MVKKIICVLTFVFVLTILGSTFAAAANTINVVANGKKVSFPDALPFIDNNARTQVPIRIISYIIILTPQKAATDGLSVSAVRPPTVLPAAPAKATVLSI